MSRASLSFVLSIVSLTFSLSLSAIAQTQPEVWEYKFARLCKQNVDAELNKYGEQGWELVSVPVLSGDCTYSYFKRPKKQIFTPTPPALASPLTCNMTPAQAPVIRGIRLGMSTDELFVLFPRSKEQSEIINALSYAERDYGVVSLNFRLDKYPENKVMFSNNIYNYNIVLFDDRVEKFDVNYSFPTRDNRYHDWTYTTWIPKLSETYDLPILEDWTGSGRNFANITCQGFRMIVTAGINDTTSISIIGPPYEEKIKQRREAASEKLRSEFKP